MFERYTEGARRALFFSRWESSQLGSTAIEAEHILLGVLRVQDEALRRALASIPLSFSEARTAIEAHCGVREPVPTAVEIPFSPEAKHTLHYAVEEADRLGHRHIGTEHLTLGVLCVDGSFAAGLLRARGLTLERLRQLVLESPPAPDERPDTGLDAVERIRFLVEDLAQTTRSPDAARGIIDEIHRLLDEVKRRLG